MTMTAPPHAPVDPVVALADDFWASTELDEFSNRSFLDRLQRFELDAPAPIDPMAAAGTLTALRPVNDRFQRRLSQRRSRRAFSDDSLTQRQVERLLAATGTGPDGRRVVPSAGGLRSVSTFALCRSTTGAGAGRVVRYDADRHALNDVGPIPDDDRLVSAFNLGADDLPAMIVVFVAHLGPLRRKYGIRGDRFALVETGCAAQNVELRLAHDRLAGYQLGGVRTEVAEMLRVDGLPARVTAALACGRPGGVTSIDAAIT